MSIAIDLYSDSCDVAVITPLDVIFREYAKEKQAIKKIASFVSNNDGAMHYFFRGAQVKGNSGAYTASGLFKESHAIDALNADSHVPHESQDHIHATFMPDATRATNRRTPNLSWDGNSSLF